MKQLLQKLSQAHSTTFEKNSLIDLACDEITYMPMALAIPPTTYLVHYQISIIYQYWLHTEIIGKLPALLEFFLSTPSHHRAHHGRNRRYIDKNFGGFLIIWDRIFGTFEAENMDDKPLYGVTSPAQSFNPLVIQTKHFVHIWKKFWEYERFGDKLSVVFKGPGWSPGKPWVGDINDIPDPAPKFEKYDPQMPLWCKYYTMMHFFFLVNAYFMLALNMQFVTASTLYVTASFLSYSCISLGFLLDNSNYGPPLEFARCLVYFLVDKIVLADIRRFGVAPVTTMYANRILCILSTALWISLYMYRIVKKIYKEKRL